MALSCDGTVRCVITQPAVAEKLAGSMGRRAGDLAGRGFCERQFGTKQIRLVRRA